jgi:hypothetical protein
MSSFRNPVGPQSSTVYWRRRLVVGLGLLAVIVIILLIVFSPKGSGTPAGTKTSDAPAVGTSETPAATDAAAPAACDPKDLTVTAVTDKASYKAGETPQLSFTITNNGAAACTVNGGSDVQEYKITSAKETYWDSKDCQVDPVAAAVAVEPGGQLPGGPIAWDRTKSSADTCDAVRTQVPAGDVTYSLTVTVDGVESKAVKIRLL